MKTISLTQGQTALVDDEDFARLSAHKWRAAFDPKMRSFYAVRSLPRDGGKRRTEHMHRTIVGASDGVKVDHKDHDTLNNQKRNLRAATHGENILNSRKRHTATTSQYKGVYWHKASSKWMGRIRVNGRVSYLGLFDDELSAANAYDAASRIQHGAFGFTNAEMRA